MNILFLLPLAGAFGGGQRGPTGQSSSAPPPAAVSERVPPPQPTTAAKPPSAQGTCGLVRVHFEIDSADLTDEDKELLRSTAQCLRQSPQLRVNVEGNTDERGSEEYNHQLGERRARSVALYLESQGVTGDQLRMISYGKDHPLCTQSDEQCWERNRRTAIRPTCHM
jgi:peptidoglycan-associated lipoprotein